MKAPSYFEPAPKLVLLATPDELRPGDQSKLGRKVVKHWQRLALAFEEREPKPMNPDNLRIDPNCPEVNGFFAAVEGFQHREKEEAVIKKLVDSWVREHLEHCPQCQKANGS